MTHQPYEDWLIEGCGSLVGSLDHPLAQAEVLSLHEHLQECNECQRLAAALTALETEFRQTPVLAPEAGFSERWLARLEVERARRHQRQSLLILGFSITGAVLLLGSLLIVGLPLMRSSNTVIWVFLYELARMFSLVNSLQGLILVILRTAVGTIPPVGWIFGSGLLSLLGVLWVVSFRLALNPRRVSL
jgi:predicted anti-sigma-YlaC factor YlaD